MLKTLLYCVTNEIYFVHVSGGLNDGLSSMKSVVFTWKEFCRECQSYNSIMILKATVLKLLPCNLAVILKIEFSKFEIFQRPTSLIIQVWWYIY